MLESILEEYHDEDILKADGFDSAVIGICDREMKLIYSVEKVIDILMNDDMSYEEAVEYYEFNIMCAYVGEKTPIFMRVPE